ncbi:MAG: glycine--tRNA ligase subunit beta [Betaproteobacteria bacterium]
MQDALLIELLTEELPPKSLQTLGRRFAEGVVRRLVAQGFVTASNEWQPFATPRRLAVLVEGALDRQPEQAVERKGPAVASGIGADGKPTKALEGFARSCGVAVDALERMHDGKADYFVFRTRKAGEDLAQHLARIVQEAINELPIPKLMRWGERDIEFVRPVHGLMMLHGEAIVAGEVLVFASGNVTRGHRFLSTGTLLIPRAQDYAHTLAESGAVVASFDLRLARIREGLQQRAAGANLGDYESLLNEVTALVEWPVVYEGRFDATFLDVPQECLILSMKQHQKYFPLLDAQSGRLLNRFLIVSNLDTPDPQRIVSGNERVLRARLSDAKFFYDQDRKTRLADRVERLGSVVYHNKLGSQLQRVQRLQKLASAIAKELGADASHAERAAWLAKADLITDMVGEFPELQGIMGQYYALHDGEDAAVAGAIEAHYHPRFANDSLPQDAIGSAVALADKLDTLVGIYGVGLVPTGDKDPFGLRRQALGVLRMLSEGALALDLVKLLELAKLNFAPGVLSDNIIADLHTFMLDRLRNYLRERGYATDEIEAVVSQNPTRIDRVVPRLAAVQAFRALPEAESLASANKRIRNILKKTTVTQTEADVAVLHEAAEKNLYAATSRLLPEVRSLVERERYTDALRLLAGVRSEVDTFFDQVMVMVDDPAIRNNRLALLSQLESLLNHVADISKLAS